MPLSFNYTLSAYDITTALHHLNTFSLQVGWILNFVSREYWRDMAGGQGLAYCSAVDFRWAVKACTRWCLAPATSAASPAFCSCSPWLPQCLVPAWTAPPAPGSANACPFSSAQPLECTGTNSNYGKKVFPETQ